MAPKPKPETLSPLPKYPEIIITMHLIGNGNPLQFHWTLFVQHPDGAAGSKFHATQIRLPDLAFDYERVNFDVATSHSITAAAVIGNLGRHSINDLDALLRTIPLNVVPPADIGKEPVFSCRVWLKEAVRRMHTAGIVICPDVYALEEEMWAFGRAAYAEIEAGRFSKASLHKATASYSPCV